MAEDKSTQATPDKGSGEPSKSSRKAIAEDYRKASPKEKLKNFKVDPVTKTLRRA